MHCNSNRSLEPSPSRTFQYSQWLHFFVNQMLNGGCGHILFCCPDRMFSMRSNSSHCRCKFVCNFCDWCSTMSLQQQDTNKMLHPELFHQAKKKMVDYNFQCSVLIKVRHTLTFAMIFCFHSEINVASWSSWLFNQKTICICCCCWNQIECSVCFVHLKLKCLFHRNSLLCIIYCSKYTKSYSWRSKFVGRNKITWRQAAEYTTRSTFVSISSASIWRFHAFVEVLQP